MKDLFTINDIVLRTGVSKSTVSRVLNQTGYVSKATSEKVKAAIEECGYRPSAIARNLSKKKSNAIGVIIPEINNPFFGEILQGISEVADNLKLNVVLCNTDNNESKEKRALHMMEDQRVEGLIITPTNNYRELDYGDDVKEMLYNLKVPVVILDRSIEGTPWDGVYLDNYGGLYNAIQLLINRGYKKIGIITNNLRLNIGRLRFEGYKNALQDNGIEIDPELVYEGDFSVETAYKIAKRLLNAKARPEAIFNCNNYTSMGFFKAIFEENIKLGTDLYYFSYGKVDFLDIIGIKYSYVDRDAVNMGKTSMNVLLERINNRNMPRKEFIIPGNLITKF